METKMANHTISLPVRFIICSVLGTCVFSFFIGQTARVLLDGHIHAGIQKVVSVESQADIFLPSPLARGDKVVPQTIYTTMNFDTRSSVISSRWLKKEQSSQGDVGVPINQKLTSTENNTNYEYDADEEEHLPAGQHLLLDIENVDYDFLNSEQQLATAMIGMVDNSGLTLLSYHCHSLKPAGVTCVGVLLESHVSFHTWPEEGVITLDLFTCGSQSLLDHLQLVTNLFAIPRKNTRQPETPVVLWAYKRRGFNQPSEETSARDTFAYPLGIHGYEKKEEVAKLVTSQGKEGFVYDVQRSIRGTQDGGNPMRFMYVNGVLKASSSSGPALAESFVHPTMIAHPRPERVLAIGSSTGATLKEILKYKSVNEVELVGLDKALFDFTRENLSPWNDCSDFAESANCLDDERIQPIYQNPSDWLRSKSREGVYDVVFVDMFDVDEETLSDFKASPSEYLSGLRGILAEDGILAIHLTQSVRSVDSQAKSKRNENKGPDELKWLSDELARAGFHGPTESYVESQSGFPDARRYVVAFRDEHVARNWHRNEAQINLEIQSRPARTRSGLPAFEYFDGSVMTAYNKVQQESPNCNRHPVPAWCQTKMLLNLSERHAIQASGDHLVELDVPRLLTSDESAQNLSASPECDASAGGNLGTCSEVTSY